jgi:hypothetical protein
MNCPTFDDLSPQSSHLGECESCRTLVALRQGQRPDAEACEAISFLLPLYEQARLSAEDRQLVEEHLAVCPACSLSVLPDVGETAPAASRWAGPEEPVDELSQRRGRKRTVLAAAGAVAAAALVAVVLWPRGTGSRGPIANAEDQRELARVDRDRESVDLEPAIPPREVDPDRAVSDPVALPSSARPRWDQPAPVAADAKKLFREAAAAIKDRQYEEAFKLCSKGLAIASDDQDGHVICGIVACKLGKQGRAKHHAESLVDGADRSMLKQVCLRDNVAIGVITGKTDEARVIFEGGRAVYQKGDAQSDLPLRPSRKDISDGMRQIKERIDGCGERHPVEGQVMLKARMKIAPEGHVASAEVTGGTPELAVCIRDVLRDRAKFRESQKGITVTYPFVFRP